MEMVVGVKGSEKGVIEDVAADKLSSDLAPLKKGADPVVYKLVRVDFDGRFVPATDDELMEVEDMLGMEKSEMLSIPDVMETAGYIPNKDDTCDKSDLENHEGLSQIKFSGVDEENSRAEAEGLMQASLPTSASSSKNRHVETSGNTGKESSSSLQDELSKSGSPGSTPDFSLIKGEIDLDTLSIRELHETFRATFGRRTSAKDKMWLKRRIVMGLTNSCDVSVTSFQINDGKLLKKEEELSKKLDCEESVAGEICNAGDDGPVNLVACSNLREDIVDDVELRNSLTESGCGSDDNHEHRAVKRVRKPTKRYIEESSDKEKDSSGKSLSSCKRFGQDESFPKSAVKRALGFHSGDFVTRPESIGGSGVQVPYVSRVRRCRPRKSITALTKFHSSDVVLTRKIVESSIAVSKPPSDDHSRVKIEETKSIQSEEPIVSEDEREKQCLTSMSDISQGREQKSVDSIDSTPLDNASGNNSDDQLATVPTAKGGMRRKHHRAWSLTEVMKLVDGVAKFGAGRWSEIKRLSFSSYTHRTSVDLKDKWRNLLKASFANSQADKGMNPRKNAPLPIPAAILVKVRELAELNGQTPQVAKRSSNCDSGSSVNKNRSEYL
ncbi:hypothetical protein BVRB_7g170100 [Beta vulgaris subsp. vulgaris]|uniref:uncharacterized protein LOC104899762 isoform X2 n=1 Tax=Beta vulgaris subsp. vulgaris TaxID=3555 RepID=UPI00053F5271|nr:uncharacterized protein LOC104899762 isoform X2 [Beta vulgaris subsp. vulgaris]KMT04840.1 hypothetical protein BVRB_7g170100 [Beta vulgaris subsp. vulgaris]